MENWRKFTLSESRERMLAKILTWGEKNLTKEVQEGQGFVSTLDTEEGSLSGEKISRYGSIHLWEKSNPNENNAKIGAFKSLYRFHRGISSGVQKYEMFPHLQKQVDMFIEEIKNTDSSMDVLSKYKDLQILEPAITNRLTQDAERGSLSKQNLSRSGDTTDKMHSTATTAIIKEFAPGINYNSIVTNLRRVHKEAAKDLRSEGREGWRLISDLDKEKFTEHQTCSRHLHCFLAHYLQ